MQRVRLPAVGLPACRSRRFNQALEVKSFENPLRFLPKKCWSIVHYLTVTFCHLTVVNKSCLVLGRDVCTRRVFSCHICININIVTIPFKDTSGKNANEIYVVKNTVSNAIKRNDKQKWRKIFSGTARREMISP